MLLLVLLIRIAFMDENMTLQDIDLFSRNLGSSFTFPPSNPISNNMKAPRSQPGSSSTSNEKEVKYTIIIYYH